MKKESSFQGSNSKLLCMNYVHSVIAGLLGCRWYTYQHSININGKRDVFSFWLIWCIFLWTVLFFYFWLVVSYDCNLISRVLFLIYGYHFPWYSFSSFMIMVALIYVSSIMILCVLHLMFNKEMFIHPLHWTILSILIVVYFTVTIFILAYLSQLFTVTYLSLKIFGPYIHIICVAFFTSFSWIFYKRWFMLVGKVEKTVWMTLWVFTLMILYSTPLLMESHISKSGVLKKPGIIAVGGASDIAPENTILAFKKAIDLGAEGLYLSIQFSEDKVPVIMRDRTLTRTTDFKKKFGEDAHDFIGSYSIGEIKSLNAGSWFLESDLCKLGDHHSLAEKMDINETKVPSWDEFLDFISHHLNIKVFMKFSLQDPYYIVIKKISEHPSINITNFYFPLTSVHPEIANSYIEDSRRPSEVNPLIHFDTIFLPLDMFIDVTVQEYQHLNIKSVMMDVNSKWLFTLAWRIRADFVATYYVHLLADMNFPLYILDSAVYLTIWLTLDIISIFITTVCFISRSADIQEVKVFRSLY